MKDLKLPVIRESLPPPQLSMDQYLKFVEFNLKYTFNRKAYEEKKKYSVVNVPFRLK